ncbi:MAG: hypothetical protein ABI333_23620 [bacterium]
MATKSKNETTEKYIGAWTELMNEQMSRFEAALEELGQRNEQALQTANAAIEEWANLAREAVTVSHQVSTDVLKASLGTTRRANEMVSSVLTR